MTWNTGVFDTTSNYQIRTFRGLSHKDKDKDLWFQRQGKDRKQNGQGDGMKLVFKKSFSTMTRTRTDIATSAAAAVMRQREHPLYTRLAHSGAARRSWPLQSHAMPVTSSGLTLRPLFHRSPVPPAYEYATPPPRAETTRSTTHRGC